MTRTAEPAPTAPAARPYTARESVWRLLRTGARLDRTQSDPVVSLRNAVGVAAPLALGTILGSAAIGLSSTIGALQTSFADRPGPYRLRILRMLGTALAAAVTSGLAVLASSSAPGSIALLLVLAFGAGLLLSAGPSATQVGTAAVAAALILGHLQQPPSVALHVGLLVFAGGAFQTLLAVAGWPLRRHKPERVALATLYRALATAARSPGGGRTAPPATDVLSATRQTLYGLGHDHGPSVEAYRVLLDEGERIRRELLVIDSAAERLAGDRNPILAGFVREGASAAGAVLDEVAAALEQARAVDEGVLDRARATLRFATGRLEDGAAGVTGASSVPDVSSVSGASGVSGTSGVSGAAPGELTRRAAAARLRALSGQLRAVVESTRTGAGEGRDGDPGERGSTGLRNPIAVLRANLSPDSAVLRHAARVSLLVAGADLVTRAVGFDRGYWVSLTVLVVLRPDFGATLQRAVMRTAGTVVGLLIASELVHWIPGGDWWDVALIAVFAFGMRLAGPGNVALSAASLSGLVVVLLAINGIAPHATLVDRSVATLIGGALAVASSLLLPSWEREFLPGRMATLLGTYRDYLAAVTDLHSDRAALGGLRAAARRARTNAEASVDRAAAEPVPAPATLELGRTVLAHSHRIIHAALTLETVRPALREGGEVPELGAFVAAADAALDAARDAVASGRPPASGPRLRPRHDALAAELDAHPERVGGPEPATTLLDATDRITNGVDTLLAEIRRQLGTPR